MRGHEEKSEQKRRGKFLYNNVCQFDIVTSVYIERGKKGVSDAKICIASM
jgi:hypothetical protein